MFSCLDIPGRYCWGDTHRYDILFMEWVLFFSHVCSSYSKSSHVLTRGRLNACGTGNLFDRKRVRERARKKRDINRKILFMNFTASPDGQRLEESDCQTVDELVPVCGQFFIVTCPSPLDDRNSWKNAGLAERQQHTAEVNPHVCDNWKSIPEGSTCVEPGITMVMEAVPIDGCICKIPGICGQGQLGKARASGREVWSFPGNQGASISLNVALKWRECKFNLNSVQSIQNVHQLSSNDGANCLSGMLHRKFQTGYSAWVNRQDYNRAQHEFRMVAQFLQNDSLNSQRVFEILAKFLNE